MAPTNFFARHGVFVRPGFLSLEESRAMRAKMRAAPVQSARVGSAGQMEGEVDEQRRKTGLASVSPAAEQLLQTRLRALKNEIEQYFGLSLADEMEPAKFLIYKPGDFFFPHKDRRNPNDVGPRVTKLRRINVVINLNDERAEPGPDVYGGGSLTLFGLLEGDAWKYMGFPITGETGVLVAFRSELLHEVTPVVHGERFNIVTRYLDPVLSGAPPALAEQAEAGH